MKRCLLGLFACFSFLWAAETAEAKEAAAEKDSPSSQLLIVNKHDNRLTFYEKGYLVRTFKVATGRVSSYTPEGDFRVNNLTPNMPYYKLNIPGGDPRNPLGNRWIGLNVPGTAGYTYGLHGTNAEWSIGSYASDGCVRMYNEEVRWLFTRVDIGARVLIVKMDHPAEEIAAEKGYRVHPKVPQSLQLFSAGRLAYTSRPGGTFQSFLSPFTTYRTDQQIGDWVRIADEGMGEKWVYARTSYFKRPILSLDDLKKR